MPSLREIVGSPEHIMGAKAVWGRSEEAVMCFGSRGEENNEKPHFAQGERTARLAQTRPYLVTIGGGGHVQDGLRGRVLELVRVTGVYGSTSVFVRGDDLKARLAQWPVAVVLSEVYAFEGEPLLVDDLLLPDRKILENAYDSVIRPEDRFALLWKALSEWPVRRRWEVSPPPGFLDPGHVWRAGERYPRVKASEGKRIRRECLALERDRRLSTEAKALNRERNGGSIVCEACGFADRLEALFDAHHPQPLAMGPRDTTPEDLLILCPTCHRWAHRKADDALSPLCLADLQEQRRGA